MSMKPEELMRKTLELAALGWPKVAPNPMVGALVVHKNKIVSRGYHKKFGEPHAEVMAITYIPSDIAASECELYVSLEPCDHHGKTPPCTELILNSGIRKVVVASLDPNPLVSGKGLRHLKGAGLEVEQGLLEKEARFLNRKFFVYHEKKRPYVTLKWAQSANGFISRLPIPANRVENLISGSEAQYFAHQLRADNMAILVGKNTVLADNSALTTRLVKGNNPLRLIIDKRLEVPVTAAVYKKDAKTVIFNEKQNEIRGHLYFVKLDFNDSVPEQILHYLYQEGIQSLLVEGGSHVINSFLKKALFDEVLIIENPDLQLNSGISAPVFDFRQMEPQPLGKDLLYRFSSFA